MSRQSVTLRDLANQLDLSTATVSRALNGFPEVNAQTRERVQKAARELGYRPNVSARKLVSGLVNAIGLVPRKESDGFIDPLMAEFLDGVTSVTVCHEVELSLFAAQDAHAWDAHHTAIAGRSVDGFIVSSPNVQDDRVDKLLQARFPFVLHGRTNVTQPYWYYDIDNYDGFHRATQLLLANGHRRIAFVGGRDGARFTHDRLSGAQGAMAELGLHIPPANIRHGEMTEDLGYRSGRAFLGLPAAERPTAYLCLNIYVAMGLLRASRERGLTCPDDFSIIVHDDRAPYLRAEFSDPPLTAVQSPIREAGARVTEMLLEVLDNRNAPPRQVVQPVELVQRRSVGVIANPD